MNTSEHFFPDTNKWDAGRSTIGKARERICKERTQHPFMPETGSDDPQRAEEKMARLKNRILKAVPPGTLYLEALMNISSYEWSNEIESAGITCAAAPIFLFNPEFLDRHCIMDSDLQMLILHELHHILYGHHVLCGDMSPAKNVAFDAVVNARLCKAWQSPVHADFFRNTYKNGGFPEILLCPPPGWPGQPDEHERKQENRKLLRQMDPKAATKVVRLRGRLYTSGVDVSYEEVLELLQEFGLTEAPPLLGNHALRPVMKTDRNRVAYPFLLDTAQAVHGLLKEAERRNGRAKHAGAGGELFNIRIPAANPRSPFLNALRKVLIKAGVYRQHLSTHRTRQKIPADYETLSVVPDWRDRTLPARADLLGMPPLLYRSNRPGLAFAWRPVGAAYVYLDVSGSMSEDLPWITGALRPLERNGLCRIFLFSTRVVPLPRGRICAGALPSTGGTDIRCILEHLAGLPPAKRPKQAVVVTDGFLGPDHYLMRSFEAFKRAKVALHGAITHDGSENPLSSIAASITRLPAYK